MLHLVVSKLPRMCPVEGPPSPGLWSVEIEDAGEGGPECVGTRARQLKLSLQSIAKSGSPSLGLFYLRLAGLGRTLLPFALPDPSPPSRPSSKDPHEVKGRPSLFRVSPSTCAPCEWTLVGVNGGSNLDPLDYLLFLFFLQSDLPKGVLTQRVSPSPPLLLPSRLVPRLLSPTTCIGCSHTGKDVCHTRFIQM